MKNKNTLKVQIKVIIAVVSIFICWVFTIGFNVECLIICLLGQLLNYIKWNVIKFRIIIEVEKRTLYNNQLNKIDMQEKPENQLFIDEWNIRLVELQEIE